MNKAAAPAEDAIRDEILRQTAARGTDRSICPSEVARALAGGGEDGPWRSLMGPVRHAAAGLSRDGRIDILRKGKPVPPAAMRGVIRLRIAAPPAAADGPPDTDPASSPDHQGG